MAAACRELGKRRLGRLEIRMTIAHNLAKAHQVPVDLIIMSKTNGGDGTLNPLLSTLMGIALPKSELKEKLVDAELNAERPSWNKIVEVSRGGNRQEVAKRTLEVLEEIRRARQ